MAADGLECDAERVHRPVWIPDKISGFVLGTLADIGTECVLVKREDNGAMVTLEYDSIFPAEDDIKKDVDDNCFLMYLNEATLLNNCRVRYERKQIYTYIANVLISINPYEQIPDLYDVGAIQKYRGRSLGTLPPHVFALADKAYRDMIRLREDQSIVVSGESGAGKTESQKHIIRYLCELWGSSSGIVEQRILEASPILEAFGNAKTLRNNNSSRFGKFIEIHFGDKRTVVGGFVSHYLLERSRVCSLHSLERGYHIFYQLIAGADEHLAQRLRLSSPDKFRYLKGGCVQFFTHENTRDKILANRRCSSVEAEGDLCDELLDDYADFERLQKSLAAMGLSQEHTRELFVCVAAVLHLGNIEFADDPDNCKGGCKVDPRSEANLKFVAELLGLDEWDLRCALISRVMQPTRGGIKGTFYQIPLRKGEASASRDGLAKAIYSRLFDLIVSKINDCIPLENSASYIGVLDVAGFEFFTVNSFEQFCINYCNEKLQQFFNERILRHEQDLYDREGLDCERIEYVDNADCIELFERKQDGLLQLLDDEARLARASPKIFTNAVHQAHKNHSRLMRPRDSSLREQRCLRDDEGFIVKHFAGAVCYETALFLEKNNDSLHASLESLMADSSNPLLAKLFQPIALEAPCPTMKSKKVLVSSVGSKFRAQLELLVTKLRNTGTHFVRCIKPNSQMKPVLFDGALVLEQLECAGTTSVLRVMHQGFPSRTPFAALYEMYQSLLPPQLALLDPRLFCKCLFRALGLSEKDFKFGLTKVFFGPGKFAEFDQMLRQDREQLQEMISRVRVWMVRARWRLVQYAVLSAVKLRKKAELRHASAVLVQQIVRGFLARKVYRPRMELRKKALALHENVDEVESVCKILNDNNKAKWSADIERINERINSLRRDLQMDPREKKQEDLDCCYQEIFATIMNSLIAARRQAVEDERERIREMEERIRLQKEKEERERRDAEEAARLREQNRLLEEARRQEVLRLVRLAAEQTELDERRKAQELKRKAEEERKKLEEQKRLEEIQRKQAEAALKEQREKELAGELLNWKYDDLRKAINTSPDPSFAAACRREYHRRMRAYREWSLRNARRDRAVSNARNAREIVVVPAASSRPQPQLVPHCATPFPGTPLPQRLTTIATADDADLAVEPSEADMLVVNETTVRTCS